MCLGTNFTFLIFIYGLHIWDVNQDNNSQLHCKEAWLHKLNIPNIEVIYIHTFLNFKLFWLNWSQDNFSWMHKVSFHRCPRGVVHHVNICRCFTTFDNQKVSKTLSSFSTIYQLLHILKPNKRHFVTEKCACAIYIFNYFSSVQILFGCHLYLLLQWFNQF